MAVPSRFPFWLRSQWTTKRHRRAAERVAAPHRNTHYLPGGQAQALSSQQIRGAMRNQKVPSSRANQRLVLRYCVCLAIVLVSTCLQVQAAETCSFVVSHGDASVGIAVFTDATCLTAGGVGCFGESSVCRYCKNKSTPQSQNFVDCTTNTKAPTPAPAPAPVPPPAPAQTPAPAPGTPVVGSAVSDPRCSQSVSPGDAGVGINIVSDPSCAHGGLGCIDTVCRYCKLRETLQSETYLSCSVITSSSPVSPGASASPVVAPSTPAPGGATTGVNAPQADFCSDALATNALAATGIWALFDPSCPQDGDLDDCNTFCRMCKFAETSASASLRTCSSVLAASASAAGAPAAVVVQAATPPANQCAATLSQDSVASGVWMKLTCVHELSGTCIETQCAYCKYFESPVSAGYAPCDDPISMIDDV